MPRSTLHALLAVGGLFGFGKKKKAPAPTAAPPPPPPTPEPPAPEPAAPAKPAGPDVRFKGLHPDTNPSASVRPMSMTCQSCGRTFRYFVNASGVKTTANCPGCGRQYRV